ncbi:MAG TPA: HAD-IIB family hydrolase, partial [Nitrospira sp.]|nr:HAD-IIB family hydrolase [Nitrospira sp.]
LTGGETSVYCGRENLTDMQRILIFSDLDGSLLDPTTYSYKDASDALAAIEHRGATLILVSSKTRAEMEPLRRSLCNHHPFIVENGGAIYVPNGTFPFPLEGALSREAFQVFQLGAPYATLRAALKEIGQEIGGRLRGFGDLTLAEVVQLTGMSAGDAQLAMQREYDEPFVMDGDVVAWQDLLAAATRRGLCCTRGGRFYHLMGANDKGMASRQLIEWYRRLEQQKGQTLVTVGLGDSLNDLPMLESVDYPILIQKPNGSYDQDVQLPRLIRADGVGPVGWNRSLIDLLPTL